LASVLLKAHFGIPFWLDQRTLQVGNRPTRLAPAIAEYRRIDKTVHTLIYIDDEAKRRGTLTHLNRGEGRHSVARAVFHGRRGELRQHYRKGKEDQLGALGLVRASQASAAGAVYNGI